MEGLIIAIVIFVISSVLGKDKKKEKPTKQMPPFSPQKAPPVKPTKPRPQLKSLEDFANEVFGQLNEKAAQKPVQQIDLPQTTEVEATSQQVTQEVKEVRQSTRPKLAESKRTLVQQATSSQIDFVPRTRKQFTQAMVMAEILGPPKAKQRKS